MNKHLLSGIAATTFVASLALAAPASAAVNVNLDTVTGSVGKGDVQTATAWNNAQLQANAGSVKFEVRSVVTQTAEWVCSRTNPSGKEQRNEQVTITTTSKSAAAHVVTRERNQVSGFALNGIAKVTESVDPDPTTVGECGSATAGWSASPVTYGELVTESQDLYLLAGGSEYVMHNS